MIITDNLYLKLNLSQADGLFIFGYSLWSWAHT